VLLFFVERTLILHVLWGTFAIVATTGVAAVVLCVLSMLRSGLTARRRSRPERPVGSLGNAGFDLSDGAEVPVPSSAVGGRFWPVWCWWGPVWIDID